MLMDAQQISKMIRDKKKQMMANPEVVENAPLHSMNGIDVFNKETDSRIEETLMSPHKINSDDNQDGYDGVGLSPEQKTRMARLRKYISTMDM